MPTGNATVFDIGEKMESEINRDVFSSGAVVITSQYDNLTNLFDGNLSTGINNTWPGHQTVWYTIQFPISIYVRNVTAKPKFGGSSSSYTVGVRIGGSYVIGEPLYWSERTFILNCPVDALEFTIKENGTNQFYFNDFIINYIPLNNSTGFLQEINELRNLINSFQNQINNFNNQFIDLNYKITELNNTFNILNVTQKQILENISNLWYFYNQLNESIINLYQHIDNFNASIFQNITQIENNLNLLEIDINNVWQNIDNLSINISEFPKIQQQIDMILLDIDNLNENITLIKNSIPTEYDDSTLSSRILYLESENLILQRNIENKTQVMDRLSLEIENHTTEIEILTSELDELKQTEKEKIIEKEADNTLSYSAIVLGILGIVIAIGAIGLLFKKLGRPPEPPIKEEPEITPIPEQQVIDYTGQPSQEQTQVIQEVQSQKAIQVQQQEDGG